MTRPCSDPVIVLLQTRSVRKVKGPECRRGRAGDARIDPVQNRDDDIRRVHRVLDDLRLESLVDVHTHFMPHSVLAKVWNYFDSVDDRLGTAWPIEYRVDEDERTDLLRRYRVGTFTSLLYPHKPGMAEWLNGWAAEFADRTPDCVRTATFHPEPDAARYVRTAVEDGVGVMKCHVQVGDIDVHDPYLDDVWAVLDDAAVPVVIHCGSGPEPGRHTGPDPIRALLHRFPTLTLLIAHMGMPEYEDFLTLAETFDNVGLDTTMVFTDFTEQLAPYPRSALPRLRDLQDKIVFGSDFPNIPYSYAHAVESVVGLGLGDDWSRAVLHDNWARFSRRTAP
ncbi:amidohydrolase [Rhodococcus sp. BP-332]|nr:amidohydrolase [Rhodococcus sp. BP-332]